MNFTTIRQAIRAAVITALGVPDTDVFWSGTTEASGWHSWDPASGRPPCRVELRLMSVMSSGIDEERQHFDQVSGTRTAESCGNRQLTVTVTIESESQADGEEAVGQLASYLRTRLRRTSVLETLRASGVSLAEIKMTHSTDYVDQDRMLSVSVTDILFLAAESDKDVATSTGWIDHTGTHFTGTKPATARNFQT